MVVDPSRTQAKPVVLLSSRATAELKDLEIALYSAGYRVVSARSEHETLDKVRTHQPDAVVLDRELTQSLELCQALRANPAVSPAAPILLTQDAVPSAGERLDALRSGAWDVQGPPNPPDFQELQLRLSNYLAAKLEVDRLNAESLIDRGTGLYNVRGFTQRATELASLTNRQGLTAACAVFRPVSDLLPPSRNAGDRLGRAFKGAGRLSDAIGRTAPTEFAVFAPATNDWAAARLVNRLRDHVAHKSGLPVRAAFSAGLAQSKVEPAVLLNRARQSLAGE